MEDNLYLGIDPGPSGGGLAVITEHGEILDQAHMPVSPADILDFVDEYKGQIVVAVLEDVHAMPKQGVSSTFKFGKNVGHLEMMLLAHQISTLVITPNRWQGYYGLVGRGSTKTEHKNILKAKAQQLYPKYSKKITLATADAVLLAHYGLKTWNR